MKNSIYNVLINIWYIFEFVENLEETYAKTDMYGYSKPKIKFNLKKRPFFFCICFKLRQKYTEAKCTITTTQLQNLKIRGGKWSTPTIYQHFVTYKLKI